MKHQIYLYDSARILYQSQSEARIDKLAKHEAEQNPGLARPSLLDRNVCVCV